MPKYTDIKKVLVLGSGPIVIGQAAEFDYAGTQACRALKEEGLEVVLINSNPATIMTDKDIADHVYIEPMNLPSITQIIEKERPDALLPNMGGQTGLNLAMALYENGTLEKYGVRLLGTSPASIHKAEDRQGFKDCMESIGQPCVTSKVVNTVEDAVSFTNEIGYPVIVRPAYTLGGTGGGIAYDEVSLREICDRGLNLSRVHEVLIERCIAGWKEIEFEVMRDSAGNVITICSMENIDPVGVHTGDSIVVAPTQTLANREFQMLRSAALDIISALEIEGGCNVQFALNPDSFEYAVIEVNPRVSRSSALASKATGYPIAKVAAKVALGYTLDEIPNAVTGKTTACFEPTIDYCVLKIPRLPFDKFTTASRTLGTQMKATGEVMAIANSFEGALMKAIRSLELNVRAPEAGQAGGPVHRRDRGPAGPGHRRASLCGGRGPAPRLLPPRRSTTSPKWTSGSWTASSGSSTWRTSCPAARVSPDMGHPEAGQGDVLRRQLYRHLVRHDPGPGEGPAGAVRHHPLLQDGGHLRRRVRRRDPLLLLHL